MKKEIDAALDLLASYVQRFGSIKEESIEEFRTKLQENLLEHYQGHWYPGKLDIFVFLSCSIFIHYFR
jgi:hypothetical protein